MSAVALGYTILYVNDVEASVSFYEKAFGLKTRFIAPDKSYAEMLTGNTTLSFAQHKLAESNLSDGYERADASKKAFGIEIGFTTADVAATYQKAIEAGAVALEPVKTKPWGQEVGYVRDLDGFLLEICSVMHNDEGDSAG